MNNNKKQMWQAVKFTLFSVSAGIIQVGSFALMEIFIKDYWIPYLVSLVMSIIWNFTFNRKFTFKSAVNVPKAMALVLAFYAVFTPLSTWWGDALVSIGWDDTLVLIMTMVINFLTEYVYDALVVFREKKKDDDQPTQEEEHNDLDAAV